MDSSLVKRELESVSRQCAPSPIRLSCSYDDLFMTDKLIMRSACKEVRLKLP